MQTLQTLVVELLKAQRGYEVCSKAFQVSADKSLISKPSFLLVFLPILSIAENIPVTNKFIKKGSIIKQEDITELQVEKSANLNLIDGAQLLVGSLAMKDINANLSISKN